MAGGRGTRNTTSTSLRPSYLRAWAAASSNPAASSISSGMGHRRGKIASAVRSLAANWLTRSTLNSATPWTSPPNAPRMRRLSWLASVPEMDGGSMLPMLARPEPGDSAGRGMHGTTAATPGKVCTVNRSKGRNLHPRRHPPRRRRSPPSLARRSRTTPSNLQRLRTTHGAEHLL